MSEEIAPPPEESARRMPELLSSGGPPPCPVCQYDLRATIHAGRHTCPECGWEFTDEDLALLGPSNLRGEPRSLRHEESRIKGPLLLVILALISIAFVAVTIYLTSG